MNIFGPPERSGRRAEHLGGYRAWHHRQSVFTATMAYALSRPIVGQRTVMFMVVFALLFSAGMIPTYLVVQETGSLDSIWSLILPVAIAPFNLIVIRQFS